MHVPDCFSTKILVFIGSHRPYNLQGYAKHELTFFRTAEPTEAPLHDSTQDRCCKRLEKLEPPFCMTRSGRYLQRTAGYLG